MRHSILALSICLTIGTVVANQTGTQPVPRTLTFEDRVAAQRAIEQVYWSHRIWPAENRGPKPPLSAVMSEATLRSKVEDYLRKSNALEKWWQRPITAEQLQEEMDRMARGTRAGATLQDLYDALANDPLVIAETLARQTLVDRLIHDQFAADGRFNGNVKADAMAALAACNNVDCLKTLGGDYREWTWKRSVASDSLNEKPGANTVHLSAEDWADHLERLATVLGTTAQSVATGRISRLEETPEGFHVVAVLQQRDGEMTTASMAWQKRSFDTWWDAARGTVGTLVDQPSGTYTLPAEPMAACANDTWAGTSLGPNLPSGRFYHSAVWTGSEMIVWGGYYFDGAINQYLNTGGRYNPSTDTWTATSTGANVPSPRAIHTAVWTGLEMTVWGGDFNDPYYHYFNTGGRYNPSTDTWTATSTDASVPAARAYHTAVWTGSEMIVWGGAGGSSPRLVNSGGRYNPSTDTWTATSTGANVPSRRYSHTAAWTGSEMIVWGGNVGNLVSNTGGRYNASTDTWAATSTGANVPAARSVHTAVWTGTRMIVWGGQDDANPLNSGGLYSPSSDTWTATSMGTNVPVPRSSHTAAWTGSEMIVWGGSYVAVLNSGGRYNPSTDTWTLTSTGAQVPEPHRLHTAVWTGPEMIVWGGTSSSTNFSNTGGTYCACPGGRIYYRDADGDGYGDPGVSAASCDGTLPTGYVADSTDCNDSSASVHPSATEVCNGIDDDCNGQIDEDASGVDSDLDGVHNLCDNCIFVWNANQAGSNHDGIGDACDVNDGLIYLYSTDRNKVEWQKEHGFTSWNVYEGDLSVLRATGVYTQLPASNPLAARACGVVDASVADSREIAPGVVKFSLVAGVAGGVESSLGTNSAGVPRPNTNPCP